VIVAGRESLRRRAFVAVACLLLGVGAGCDGRAESDPVDQGTVPTAAEQWFANYHDAERQGVVNVPPFLAPEVVIDYGGLGPATATGRDAALVLLGTQWNQSTGSRTAAAPIYLSQGGAINQMRVRSEFRALTDAVFIDDIGALGIMSETYAGSEMAWHSRGVRYSRLPEIRERARRYVVAWSTGDADAIRALYAGDATLIDDLAGLAASGASGIEAIAGGPPAAGGLPRVTLDSLGDLGGPASFPVGKLRLRDEKVPLQAQVLLVTADDGTGCPGQMAIVLRLDVDGLIVQDQRYHRVDALVRCSPDGTLPPGWWDDVTVPPAIASELTGTLDLGGQAVRVYNAANGLDQLVEWAFNRFTSAGLTPPEITSVTFVDKRADQCDNILGLIVDRQVTLCFLDTVCTNDACDQWTRASKATALHELAHAWIDDNVDAATRDRFLELAGLEAWAGAAVPWGDRGVELAATTIAWGLLDEETPISRKLGPRTCPELTELYDLLVGGSTQPYPTCTPAP
jgi:hypothetical protein